MDRGEKIKFLNKIGKIVLFIALFIIGMYYPVIFESDYYLGYQESWIFVGFGFPLVHYIMILIWKAGHSKTLYKN